MVLGFLKLALWKRSQYKGMTETPPAHCPYAGILREVIQSYSCTQYGAIKVYTIERTYEENVSLLLRWPPYGMSIELNIDIASIGHISLVREEDVVTRLYHS